MNESLDAMDAAIADLSDQNRALRSERQAIATRLEAIIESLVTQEPRRDGVNSLNHIVSQLRRDAAVRLPEERPAQEKEESATDWFMRMYRLECYARELVALHRVRGPMTPTCEMVCREATAFVDDRAKPVEAQEVATTDYASGCTEEEFPAWWTQFGARLSFDERINDEMLALAAFAAGKHRAAERILEAEQNWATGRAVPAPPSEKS